MTETTFQYNNIIYSIEGFETFTRLIYDSFVNLDQIGVLDTLDPLLENQNISSITVRYNEDAKAGRAFYDGGSIFDANDGQYIVEIDPNDAFGFATKDGGLLRFTVQGTLAHELSHHALGHSNYNFVERFLASFGAIALESEAINFTNEHFREPLDISFRSDHRRASGEPALAPG